MDVQEMEQGFQKIWELFQAWNIEVDRVYQRVKAHKKSMLIVKSLGLWLGL
jgi:hypothetical protein